MLPALASALVPPLRRLEAERAHRLAVLALRLGLAGEGERVEGLATRCMGIDFPNPVGLAAGFDKDAVAVRGLSRLGFGFVETGTVTPLPQEGNPRPRVFRLEADRAVINRYGLNNRGLPAYLHRLRTLPKRRRVPVGANVGINKDGAVPERDYPALVAAVAPDADYVVINVSSPNTPGLRDLQGEARMRAILEAVRDAVPSRPPLLVKVAPDLDEAGLEALVEAAVDTGVDGLVVGNTTVARPAHLRAPERTETGGLSGPPLFELSTTVLARAYRLAKGRLALIGCGGVADGATALAKLKAGADLVQLYTSFAYAGPALPARIARELRFAMDREGFRTVRDAVGAAS